MISAPTGKRKAAVRTVTVARLADQTWPVREPGSGTAATADELLTDLGIHPPRLTLGSNGAIRQSVMVGLGIALVSRAAVAREIAEGALEEWRAGPLPLRRHWHLVARSDETLPATAALFRDHLLGENPSTWAPCTPAISPNPRDLTGEL